MTKQVTIYTVVNDCGDGSYTTRYFKNKETMELFQKLEEENVGYSTDGEGTLILTLDEEGNPTLANSAFTSKEEVEQFWN